MNKINPVIYGLVDPLEPNEVRYAGIATVPGRPRSHEGEAIWTIFTSYKLSGKIQDYSGLIGWHTPEARLQASESNKQKWADPLYHEQMVQIVKDRWKNPDFIIRLSDSNRNGKSLIEESTEISRLNQRLYTHSRIVETSQDPIRVSRSL